MRSTSFSSFFFALFVFILFPEGTNTYGIHHVHALPSVTITEQTGEKSPTSKTSEQEEAEEDRDPQKTPPQETVIHQVNGLLISYIEASAEQLIGGLHTLAYFPYHIWEGVTHLQYPNILNKFADFILVSVISFSFAIIFEILSRILLFGRKKQSPPSSWKQFSFAFGLSCLPIVIFSSTAYLFVNALQKPEVRPHIHILLGSLFLGRLLLTYFRLFLTPAHRNHRFISLNDRNARRFYRLISLFVQIFIFGTFMTEIFRVIGVAHAACETWKSIMGFIMFLLFSTLVIDYKRSVARMLRYKQTDATGVVRLFVIVMSMLSRLWHILALLFLLTFYLAWVYGSLESFLWLVQSTLLSLSTLFLSRYLYKKLDYFGKTWSQQWEKLWIDTVEPETLSPNNKGGATTPSLSKKVLTYAAASPVAQSAYFLVPLGKFLLTIFCVIFTFEIWGLNFLKMLTLPTTQNYLLTLLSIFLVMGGVRVLWAFVDLIINAQLNPQHHLGVFAQPSAFVQTVMPILRSSLRGLIVFIGFLLIISELSFDIMPIIYAFSVLSLAVPFGAQTIVKDVITGFLTLFEGNIQVGEVVSIGPHTGTVESITLRSVFLRHGNGSIQSIPFSEVHHIINKSRDYTRQLFTVIACHMTSIKVVEEVFQKTFQDIQQHPRFGDMILEPLNISGVAEFTDTSIRVRASIKTQPDPKEDFFRAFNSLLQENLMLYKVLPPLQHQTTHTF